MHGTCPPLSRAHQPRLAAVGAFLARNKCLIQGLQWGVVAFYLILVTLPAFQPLPQMDAHILDNLVLFAQFLFWGIWWPFVILSMLVMGRSWCGLFCPEGTLTEWASQRGLGKPVPGWMKWSGWPFIAFILTTLYGQLISVYEYPQAALLILGGSTVAAIIVGFIYGRSKRVWCRHLCPVSGVFSLLARLSPAYYKVDRAQWDSMGSTNQPKLNCAPLIDVRRMEGASECHMCGRCAGHRSAVTLSARLPGSEITQSHKQSPWDIRLLVFGLLGVAFGAFQWSASPWLVQMKMKAAEWLVEHDSFILLQDNAPWWILTHYPQANDSFTWLDGLTLLTYIGTQALLIGGWIWLSLHLAGRWLPGDAKINMQRLAAALIPLGGANLFVGLSQLTTGQLAGEGWDLGWLPATRMTLIALAMLWSLLLGWKLSINATRRQHIAITTLLALAMLPVPMLWWLQFYRW